MQLCLKPSTPANFYFSSSVSSVFAWPGPGLVPEAVTEKPEYAQNMGCESGTVSLSPPSRFSILIRFDVFLSFRREVRLFPISPLSSPLFSSTLTFLSAFYFPGVNGSSRSSARSSRKPLLSKLEFSVSQSRDFLPLDPR